VKFLRRRSRPGFQSLSQWCAVHLHDATFGRWVSFRFPEAVDHFDLVQVQRPIPDLSEIMLGPDSRTAPPRWICPDRPAHDEPGSNG
jgi:hypothetical protein